MALTLLVPAALLACAGWLSGCVTRENPAAAGLCCVNGVCSPPDAGERIIDGSATRCEPIPPDASPDVPACDAHCDAGVSDDANPAADAAALDGAGQ